MIFEDDKVPSYFVRTREAGYDEDQYNENDQEYDFDDDSIAFETEANPNSNRNHVSELDHLEELERQLLSNGSRVNSKERNGTKGKARKKSKEKKRPEPKKYVVLNVEEYLKIFWMMMIHNMSSNLPSLSMIRMMNLMMKKIKPF